MLPPAVADSRARLQNHEGPLASLQMVCRGKARLTPTDDHGLDAFAVPRAVNVSAHHRCLGSSSLPFPAWRWVPERPVLRAMSSAIETV
jgi:hypothetical protein